MKNRGRGEAAKLRDFNPFNPSGHYNDLFPSYFFPFLFLIFILCNFPHFFSLFTFFLVLLTFLLVIFSPFSNFFSPCSHFFLLILPVLPFSPLKINEKQNENK